MNIKNVREVLWPKYDKLSDKTIEALVKLIYGVCGLVISSGAEHANCKSLLNEFHED